MRILWASLIGFILVTAFRDISANAAVVVLNSDQTDYTFENGNTYEITNSVQITGAATLEQGAVIKFGPNGQLILNAFDCQTVLTNPAILTARDDDRFGDILSDSTHSPSGYYGGYDPFQINCLGDTAVHDIHFYFLANGLGLINWADDETDLNFGLWNLYMQDCDWGIDCENTVSSGENILNATNLTMIDCVGGIAGHYNITGNIVDSTFSGVGSLVSDDNGYFFNPLNFSWCTFSNVSLSSFEVNVSGDHNGFANCGQFSITDYYYNGDYVGTNYFGDSWYWLTNSDISFYLSTTNLFITRTNPPVTVGLLAGTVFYYTTLVDRTDFTNAIWHDYVSSNLTANLSGATNGEHTVWVGLRGARDKAPVWNSLRFTLDTVAPIIRISSPTNSISQPFTLPRMVLRGSCSGDLQGISFDLSNAVEIVTNRIAWKTGEDIEPVHFDVTTSYFECDSIRVTNGINTFTIHASNLAGNTTTTNFSFLVDFSSRTNPPVMQLEWPQDGDFIGISSIAMSGQLDDPSTTVIATVVTNGVTNIVVGLTGSDIGFWVHDVPLVAGTNQITLNAVDYFGNTSTTNLTLIRSPVDVQVYSFDGTTVIGGISDTNYTVRVNGIQATMDGNAWTATVDVDLRRGGALEITAEPNGGGH